MRAVLNVCVDGSSVCVFVQTFACKLAAVCVCVCACVSPSMQRGYDGPVLDD